MPFLLIDYFLYSFIGLAIIAIFYFAYIARTSTGSVSKIALSDKFDHETLFNLDQLIRKHNTRVSRLKNLDHVKAERIHFERSLNLSSKLKQLYKYINLYPVWYNDPNLKHYNQPYWYSTAIKPNQLKVEKLGESEFGKLIDNYYLNQNTEILNYSFKVENDDYNLIYIKTFEYFKSFYVYKNKTNLVFKYNSEVLAFKPGVWIIHLLKLLNEVINDESKRSTINNKKIKQLNYKEIKENFINQ